MPARCLVNGMRKEGNNMCLGLATGFIKKPRTYQVVIDDYKAEAKIYERIYAKNISDALEKTQKKYPAPDCVIVSIMEV